MVAITDSQRLLRDQTILSQGSRLLSLRREVFSNDPRRDQQRILKRFKEELT